MDQGRHRMSNYSDHEQVQGAVDHVLGGLTGRKTCKQLACGRLVGAPPTQKICSPQNL